MLPAPRFVTCLVLAAAVLQPQWVGASACIPWRVDYESSRLEFLAVQADAEFVGSFGEFEAHICFAPAVAASSRFDVVVDLTSVDTRNSERDEVLTGPDFFAVARFPKARFVAGEFRGAGSDAYVASGELTLRGVTMPLSLPFRFEASPAGGTATLAGEVTLSRLAFGVGQGDWQDTTWVGDRVRVRFSLQLMAPKPAEGAAASN